MPKSTKELLAEKSEFVRRRVAAAAVLAGIEERRNAVALLANRGDEAAKSKLSQIVADKFAATEEVANVTAALSDLQKELDASYERDRVENFERRRKEAFKRAERTVALSGEIDETIKTLAGLLAERKQLYVSIMKAGLDDREIPLRLLDPSEGTDSALAPIEPFLQYKYNFRESVFLSSSPMPSLADVTRKRLMRFLERTDIKHAGR